MKVCYACKNRIKELDYKDPALSRYQTNWGKIKGRRDTGFCSKHQRSLAIAIKRARYLGLIAYTNR